MKRFVFAAVIASSIHCGGGTPEPGGSLIIKQVLRGGQATTPIDPVSAPEVGTTPPPVPGMSLGSTLVADTSRALYRRAYDQSRRRADGLTARERLSAIDEAIDDESQQTEASLEQE